MTLKSWRFRRLLTAGIPALLACSPSASDVPIQPGQLEALEAELRARHRGEPGTLTLISDAAGRITMVTGSFDTGIREGAGLDRDDMEGAAKRFLATFGAALSGSLSFRSESVQFFAPMEADARTVMLPARQTWSGIPIRGSELQFVFSDMGRLLAFVGTLYPDRIYAASDGFGVAAAVRAALPGLEGIEGVEVQYTSTDDAAWSVSGDMPGLPLLAERVADPERGAVTWRLRNASTLWIVDEPSGQLVETRPAIKMSQIFDRQVKVGEIDDPGDWQVHYDSLDSDLLIDTPVWKEVFLGGVCRYYLQSGLGLAVDNELWPHVDDHQGDGPFITGPSSACTKATADAQNCPFSFQCDRTYGDGSFFRQQHYYHYLERGLSRIRQLAYAEVEPISTWDLQLVVDEPPNGSCGNTIACFCCRDDPFSSFRTISVVESRMISFNVGLNILWHELGHYVAWSYGGFDDDCRDGNEAGAVDEAMSNVIAGLLAKLEFDVEYQDAIRGQYSSRFHDSTGNLTYHVAGAAGCPGSPPNIWGMGEAFHQALWEIAFGLNCDLRLGGICLSTLTGITDGTQPGDIGWASNEESVGALLEAIAYTEKVMPPAVTFEQVASMIFMSLNQQFPNDKRAWRAREVLAHHGLHTLPCCADLVIQSLTLSPANPSTNDLITFTVVVENAGYGVATSSILALRVGGETFPQNYDVPVLAAGQTATITRQITLGSARNYRATAIADVDALVDESKETNNERLLDFTVN